MDRKQSGDGCFETERSEKGEREPANRGTNNEDKTRDEGLSALQMKTAGKTGSRSRKTESRARPGETEETQGNSYLLTITKE